MTDRCKDFDLNRGEFVILYLEEPPHEENLAGLAVALSEEGRCTLALPIGKQSALLELVGGKLKIRIREEDEGAIEIIKAP